MGGLVLSVSRAAVIAGAAAVVAACYSPELDDCTVACGVGGACAEGLECRSDGFCHLPDSEGLCTDIDAATDSASGDADPTDGAAADATSDAAANQIMLVVNVDGRGRVVSAPLGIDCADSCVYGLDEGTEVSLAAVKDHPQYDFSEWQGACTGSSDLCDFTLEQATSVTAVFTN